MRDSKFDLDKLDFDTIIDLTSIAEEANLISAFNSGSYLLMEMLRETNLIYGRIIFSEAHLKKVFSLLKQLHTDNPSLVELKSQLRIACKI